MNIFFIFLLSFPVFFVFVLFFCSNIEIVINRRTINTSCCIGEICALLVKTGNRCLVAVVGQRYAVNVMDEHVLRGNAAIIKCHIPSFVAEFVEVDSWIEDETTDIYPNADYGTRCAISHLILTLCGSLA